MRQTIKEIETNGKKLFPPEKFEQEEWKEIMESTTDPESGYYVKDERTKQFAYSFHAAADEKGFILGTIVTPGNVHDSHMLQPLVRFSHNVHRVIIIRNSFSAIFGKPTWRRRSIYGIHMRYSKRKETIERVFADAKEKHGMR